VVEVKTKRPKRAGKLLLIGSTVLMAVCVLVSCARLAWLNELRNIEANTRTLNASEGMQKWVR
jgi:hypothetical protein